jgi:cysteine desulfurase
MGDQIYLDHNATTPVDPGVVTAMEPYLREFFGNPSSVEHEHGHTAQVSVDRARGQVAGTIHARPNEIIFTGSCTEANNLAILGVARAQLEKRHLVTTQIEHPAVLEPARALEREGWRVTYLPVDEKGVVSLSDVEEALVPETVLVSVQAANNEVGTLQPIRAIGELCSKRNVLFHTDMAQLVAYGDINVERDNIHLASFSAHKAYGPKGVGALYIRSRRPRARVIPILYGGGQERGLRPGTLNTPGIVGMGEAFAIAKRSACSDAARLKALCDSFRDQILAQISGARLNGHATERLANNLSFSIEGVEPHALILRLRGNISFSASSACATNKIETSHVLKAMFNDTNRARAAFRIAPGRYTTASDLECAANMLIAEARQLQMARSRY